jgi:hypothetical protein
MSGMCCPPRIRPPPSSPRHSHRTRLSQTESNLNGTRYPHRLY